MAGTTLTVPASGTTFVDTVEERWPPRHTALLAGALALALWTLLGLGFVWLLP